MVTLGIDYAGHPPTPAAIKAAGFAFVCRYLSPPPNGKNLTFPEAQAMLHAGIDVVSIWESTANAALGGHAVGVQHGTRARLMADACGAPPSAAIYYAVDFDAQPNQFAKIGEYQAGFADGIGPHPVGVYGSAAVVQAMLARGARYAWQTCAWSYGSRMPGAHLYQRAQTVKVGGTLCDVDEASGVYGGWLTPTPIAPVHRPLPPALTGPEEPTMLVPMQLPVTAQGEGAWDADGLPADPAGKEKVGYPRPLVPWQKFRAVTVNGNDASPSDDDRGFVRANQHGDITRISFGGFPPGSSPLVWIQTAV